MATEYEFHDKKEWWLNELGSLGIRVNKTNEFNDLSEISNLAKVLKRPYFADYKSIHSSTD